MEVSHPVQYLVGIHVYQGAVARTVESVLNDVIFIGHYRSQLIQQPIKMT